MGLPVGGIANCVAPIAHTQGWLHCDIPATDASGVAKGLWTIFMMSSKLCKCRTRSGFPLPVARSTGVGRQMSRL
jgi:dissimilatory sulfite reductase (desulfoviridin) alpha/beta subunit